MKRTAVALGLLASSACVETAIEPGRPLGVYLEREGIGATTTPHLLAAPRRRILFMNRMGGTFTPGYDDSAANRSTIPWSTSYVPP